MTGDVEHGKYIVHDLVQCTQCHSPRDESGVLLTDRLLTGAPVPVRSPFPWTRSGHFMLPVSRGCPAIRRTKGFVS